MILVPLAVLLLAVSVAEIAIIIKVGELIGVWPTIAILVGEAVLGSWLIRHQGRAVWRRFNETLAAGRIPAREVLDGVLVIVGGAFLIAPGFLTDVVGIVFLAPPTRALVRRGLLARIRRGLWGGRWWWRRRGPPRSGSGGTADVEGTAVEVDRRELRS